MKITQRHILWGVLLFEAVTAYLVAVGAWPQAAAWFSVAVVAFFILLASPLEALVLSIASIPFYLVVPNPYFDALPAWRLVFLWLFAVWLAKSAIKHYRAGSLAGLPRAFIGRLFAWDKYLILFVVMAWLSVLLARFPGHAAKQMLFLVNVGLLYAVLVNVVATKEHLLRVIKATAVSLGLLVFFGYVQFISSLFADQYYFWQYWALLVSKAYYGTGLAEVLVYSNSWFSYTGEQSTLRMFGIMPDSHSFGVVCFFLLGYLAACLPNVGENKHRSILVWAALALTAWALILSGTRGIWVGLFVPAALAAFLYWKGLARWQARRFLAVTFLIVAVFALSPWLAQGLNYVRSGLGGGNFLERVGSIYDLEEQSNAGRLVMWKDSAVYALRHPLGVGYGNFIVSVVHNIAPEDTFEDAASQKNLRYNLPQKFVTAHSLYLNILVELGLVGIVVFALAWVSYAAGIWRFIKNYGADRNIFTGMAVGGSFALLWLLAYGAFDLTLFNDKVLAYALVTLGIGGLIFRNYKKDSQEHPNP